MYAAIRRDGRLSTEIVPVAVRTAGFRCLSLATTIVLEPSYHGADPCNGNRANAGLVVGRAAVRWWHADQRLSDAIRKHASAAITATTSRRVRTPPRPVGFAAALRGDLHMRARERSEQRDEPKPHLHRAAPGWGRGRVHTARRRDGHFAEPEASRSRRNPLTVTVAGTAP